MTDYQESRKINEEEIFDEYKELEELMLEVLEDKYAFEFED